jgi:hypothetical protein
VPFTNVTVIGLIGGLIAASAEDLLQHLGGPDQDCPYEAKNNPHADATVG